jgi:hypothetical protein
MAKQLGTMKIVGTVGNITYYRSQGKFFARLKTGVSKKRMATDPCFENSRRHAMEFGEAAKAGKLLRLAFRQQMKNIADTKITSRLTKELLTVLRTDPFNEKGERKVADGDVGSLTGFDFNQNAKLANILLSPYTTMIDRPKGKLKIEVDLTSGLSINAPDAATHFKIISGAAEIDFEDQYQDAACCESDFIALDNSATDKINHVYKVTRNSKNPLFIVLGVVFYQVAQGHQNLLSDKSFNTLGIVNADRIQS